MNEIIILYYDWNGCSDIREFKDYDDLNYYLNNVYLQCYKYDYCSFKITKIRVIKDRAL